MNVWGKLKGINEGRIYFDSAFYDDDSSRYFIAPEYDAGMIFDFLAANSWKRIINFFATYGMVFPPDLWQSSHYDGCNHSRTDDESIFSFGSCNSLKSALAKANMMRPISEQIDLVTDDSGKGTLISEQIKRVLFIQRALRKLLILAAAGNGNTKALEDIRNGIVLLDTESALVPGTDFITDKLCVQMLDCKDISFIIGRSINGLPDVSRGCEIVNANYQDIENWLAANGGYEDTMNHLIETSGVAGWYYLIPDCNKSTIDIARDVFTDAVNRLLKSYSLERLITPDDTGGFALSEAREYFDKMLQTVCDLAVRCEVGSCKECGEPIDLSKDRGTPKEFCDRRHRSCATNATNRRRSEAIRLHNSGFSDAEIAERLNWNIEQIRKWSKDIPAISKGEA